MYMRTPITLTFILLIFFAKIPPSYGQDTTFYDEDWKEVASMDLATYYGFLTKENKQWMLRDYYASNDQLQSEGAYKSKKRETSIGLWTYYYENGTKQKEVNYVDDVYEGPYTEWYENGNIKKTGNYKAGKGIGFWEGYFENGKKKYEVDYKGGHFNEVISLWYQDGTPAVVDGNGDFIGYFDDGKVKVTGKVVNKLREGEFLVYSPSGYLLEKVHFIKNKTEGSHQYYYENGQIESEGLQKGNFPFGFWQFYTEDGSTSFVKNYDGERRSEYAVPYQFGSREPVPINVGPIKRMVGYPGAAIRRNIEGQVICRVLVDKDGSYIKHKMVKSTNPIFSRAVERHINKIRFTYALQGGRPIKFWVNIPFNFRLVD